MNEQLAAIKARRAAVTTPFLEGNAGRKMQGIAQPMVTTVDDQHQVLAFLMAAPDDIDTLLAEVERLTALDETRRRLQDDAQVIAVEARRKEADAVVALSALTAERDERSLVAEQLSMVLHIRDTQLAALTAERDALAQQLQQAQAQLAGDVVEPILWKAAPPKRHEWDEDAATTPSA